MKILENKVREKSREWPKNVDCIRCGSKLEIDEADIMKGDMFYSQREIDYNVKGVICPCCGNFTAI